MVRTPDPVANHRMHRNAPGPPWSPPRRAGFPKPAAMTGPGPGGTLPRAMSATPAPPLARSARGPLARRRGRRAVLGALAALSLAGAAGAGERAGSEARAAAAERDAWLGRSCAAPGCADPRAPSLGHTAAFAGAVLAAAGLARRRRADV